MRTLANLRLRSKILISLVLIIAGLSCATLLVVRDAVHARVREEIARDASNSLAVFEILHHQGQAALSRRADVLADLAFLSDNNAAAFEDSAENPLEGPGSDLVALADRDGKVLSLHAAHSRLSVASAEELLRSSLSRGKNSDWWYDEGRLYQVELQPIASDSTVKNAQSGTVIVGQAIEARGVHDLGRLLSSQVAFRYDGHIVATTLDPYQERELSDELRDHSSPRVIRIGRDRFLASSVDLTPGAPREVSLLVLKSDSETTAFLERLNRLLLGLGLVAVLAGGFLVFVISDAVMVPLRRLVEGVRALERGDFEYQLTGQGGDEVAQVTRAFDRMRRTLQTNAADKELLEEQLRQSQKMEALGRLAGGVAHDFNNLLTIIKGHSELLLGWLKGSELSHKSCTQIDQAADRAAALTRQLLIFSRRQVLQPKVLNLNALVADTNKLLERLIREDIEYVFRPGALFGHMKADPGQIEQVLLNLVVNACDAMPQGGKLKIETRDVSVDEGYRRSRPTVEVGEYILLSATDTGHGMDESTKARIFEPFFTTKENGKGTGLGLATVYGVVSQSGGFIWVDSVPGQGTRFEIYFPRVGEDSELAPVGEAQVRLPRGAATVIVVEDETAVRELACEFLRSSGYDVLAAQDGMEALEIAGRSGKSIRAVVTDVVMPKMRGTELAARLKRFLPDVGVVYMSGYLEHNEESEELMEYGLFVQKPFTRDSLIATVGEALKPDTGAARELDPATRKKKEARIASSRLGREKFQAVLQEE
jgi:signal transduction histidine kinase/FixJ family two-component response regulator